MTSEQIRKAVEEAQKPLVERVDKIAKQRTLALLVAALSLITAATAIVYGINREAAFQAQLDANRRQTAVSRIVVCAAAKNTALSPRQEPLGSESRNHYLNRLESQREQLVATAGLHCPSLKGFATFSFLRSRAITEIETILRRLAPAKLQRALDQELGTSAPTTSTSPTFAGTAPNESAAPEQSKPPESKHPPNHDSGKTPDHGGSKEPPVTTPAPAPTETPTTATPAEQSPQSSPEKPGFLDPTIELVCEVTAGIELCHR